MQAPPPQPRRADAAERAADRAAVAPLLAPLLAGDELTQEERGADELEVRRGWRAVAQHACGASRATRSVGPSSVAG